MPLRASHAICSVAAMLLLAGCNARGINIVSAKRAEYLYYTVGQGDKNSGEKLVDIARRFTGSAKTGSIRTANPHARVAVVPPGTLLRIPTKILKTSIRHKAFPEPAKQSPRKMPAAVKKAPKIDSSDVIEILPGGEMPNSVVEPQPDNETFKVYEEEPFQPDKAPVLPEAKPPAPDPQELEERRLREKYQNIMRELGSLD